MFNSLPCQDVELGTVGAESCKIMLTSNKSIASGPIVLPDGNGGYEPCPELMTEQELIRFLRVPEISKAGDHRNVIENLKRFHGLPCIHISKQCLYPLEAIRQWVQEKVTKER